MSRGASVRNGLKPLPPMLNIDKARPKQTYEIRDEQISEEPRRLGTQRAASEARIPPRRKEPPSQTRRRIPEEEGEDEYPGELYDMYRNSRGARSNGGKPRNQPQYIEEMRKTLVNMMMALSTNKTLRWFQIAHLHHAMPAHHHNHVPPHEGQRFRKSGSKCMRQRTQDTS